MSYPILTGGSFDFIRESYTLLAEELEDVLRQPKELFSNSIKNDILGGILAKVDNALLVYDLDTDQKDEVRTLGETAYATILEAFKNEFVSSADSIETAFSDISQRSLAETIYKYIYLQRRDVLMAYLLSEFFNNRAQFSKQYKTVDSKKDITYQSIRSELTIKNPDYYILLMNYTSIVNDILTDDETSIIDIFTSVEMGEEEAEMLNALFEGSAPDARAIMVESLLSSDFYHDFLSDFRFQLSNVIKQAV